jgi:hypothetical protein
MRISHLPGGCTLARTLAGVALAPVRTALCIDAISRQAQPLHWPASNEVLLHNRRSVSFPHISVPYRFRIDHYCRSVLALVKAARLVYAHCGSQPGRFAQLLQLCVQFAFAVRRARWAWSALRARVMTYENMVLEWGQSAFLLSLRLQVRNRQLPRPGFPHFATAGDRPHLRKYLLDHEHG